MLRFTVLAACEHLHISQKLYYEYSVPRPVYMCSIRGRDKKKIKKNNIQLNQSMVPSLKAFLYGDGVRQSESWQG